MLSTSRRFAKSRFQASLSFLTQQHRLAHDQASSARDLELFPALQNSPNITLPRLAQTVRRFPNVVALEFEESKGLTSESFYHFYSECLQAAEILRNVYHIKPGDVVATSTNITATLIKLNFACQMLNVSLAPLHKLNLTPELRTEGMKILNPALIITQTSGEYGDIVSGLKTVGCKVISFAKFEKRFDESASSTIDFKEMDYMERSVFYYHLQTIDVSRNAIINFTSGTEQTPKLLPRFYYSKMMLNNLEFINSKLFHDSLSMPLNQVDASKTKYLTKLLATRLPTTFTTGFYWALLSYGMTFCHTNDLHEVWPFIQKNEINLINGMPALFQFSERSLLPYISENDAQTLDLSSLRLIALSGDVPRNYYLLHVFKNLVQRDNIKIDASNLNIFNFYASNETTPLGMTEMFTVDNIINSKDDKIDKKYYYFTPISKFSKDLETSPSSRMENVKEPLQMRVNEENQTLEVYHSVLAQHLDETYFHRKDLARSKFTQDEWMKMNDSVTFVTDEDGNELFTVHGRYNDMITYLAADGKVDSVSANELEESILFALDDDGVSNCVIVQLKDGIIGQNEEPIGLAVFLERSLMNTGSNSFDNISQDDVQKIVQKVNGPLYKSIGENAEGKANIKLFKLDRFKEFIKVSRKYYREQAIHE